MPHTPPATEAEGTVTITVTISNRQLVFQTRKCQLGLGWKLQEPELTAIYMWAGVMQYSVRAPSSTLSLVPTSMNTICPQVDTEISIMQRIHQSQRAGGLLSLASSLLPSFYGAQGTQERQEMQRNC